MVNQILSLGRLDRKRDRTHSSEVIRHLDKFIFKFAWALLSSVAFFLGGYPLPESHQVYSFVGEICESLFKLDFHLVELRLTGFHRAVDLVFERNLLLQFNDPLQI